MGIKTPAHQIVLNASKTFFSASEALLIKTKERRDNSKKNDEYKKKEIQDLKHKLEEKIGIINNLKQQRSSLFVEQERKLMHKEYQTIIYCYHILGMTNGISKKVYETINWNYILIGSCFYFYII